MTTQMHDAGMEPPAGELSANDDVMGGDQDEEAETSPAASSGMSSESFVEEMLLKPFKHGEQRQANCSRFCLGIGCTHAVWSAVC